MLTCSLPGFSDSIPLFNGKDTAGWEFSTPEGKAAWSVKDGVLACSGEPIGYIRTEKEYENYSLTLEWRWQAGAEKANSGLLLHISTPNAAGPWPKCIESQLGQGNAGDIWTIGEKAVAKGVNKGGRWIRTADPAEKTPGEWNTMTVTCKGDSLTITVNGVTVNEATGLSAAKGAIGVQSEGSPIEFRNIVLTAIE
ncbi:DUF1080 domain-containing protein [Akkermansiaceae bacterium]|nr:DUF1080 domain-containing protein [Akkermansiaceae bacterium]